jgi:hypothetical protein
MQSKLDRIGPIPPVWELDGGNASASGIRSGPRPDRGAVEAVLADARGWVRELRGHVDVQRGRKEQQPTAAPLSASKHRHELGVLLERILVICSDAAGHGAAADAASPSAAASDGSAGTDPSPNTGTSSAAAACFEECRNVLSLMDSWNLDWQQRHVDCAIHAASRAGLWGEAAEMFEERIDPDGGNRPYDVAIAEPAGLYALARRHQPLSQSSFLEPATPREQQPAGASGTSAVDAVLDAVRRMTMLSPTDQPSYLLAAGTALGRAGEWRGLVNYLRDPSTKENAENLGQVS